jgi:hypothetical protein
MLISFKFIINRRVNYNLFDSKKYIVGDIEWGGFGAMYARRKLIMQIGHAFDRTPIFRYTNYIYDDPFEPFDVNFNSIKKKGIREVEIFDFTKNDKDVLFFDFGKYWNSQNMCKYQCWCPQDSNYMMYSGYMYGLLKLNKTYENRVQECIDFIKEKYEIKGFDNLTGLHLRRGDKISETSYLSDEYLFNYIDENNLGNSFFVTSDDLDYIHEIEKKYPRYDFVYDSEEKRYGDAKISNVDMVVRNPALKEQETLMFMKNVEILKQCKAVVGIHSAQMTKIAGSMNSFSKNKNSLHLLDPNLNKRETMGSSEQTS